MRDSTISRTTRYDLVLERATPAAQSGAKPPPCMPALDQHFTRQGAGLLLPPKIPMQWSSALTPSYLCSLNCNRLCPSSRITGDLVVDCVGLDQTSFKASLTPSPTSRRLLQELQNSDDKSSQHFHRIRDHGVLKCLTTVKRKKKLQERNT